MTSPFTFRSLINSLAVDLKGVDLSLIDRDITISDKNIQRFGFDSQSRIGFSEDESYRVLDETYFLIAKTCADRSIIHPDWALLSGRVQSAQIRQRVAPTFSEAIEEAKMIWHEEFYEFCIKYASQLNKMIDQSRDGLFDTFAMNTLKRSYLMKTETQNKDAFTFTECPQYWYLRVAVWHWFPMKSQTPPVLPETALEQIKEMYDDISNHIYTPATPTLQNSGTRHAQGSSCFLKIIDDDMRSISKDWHDTAIISKYNGGIGTDYTGLRHSKIGFNGFSRGIVPWLKISNEILSTVDQGGDKRKGSGACFLQPWHVDIFAFLDLKKNHGAESMRARDLFYALWVHDIFMRRVENDEMWSLFCPNKAKGLVNLWGVEFEMAYLKYEQMGIFSKQVRARTLWEHVLNTQIETGMPYMVYADACNRKSNQRNLGTIRNSNLCVEIVEYSDSKNIASCNLSSISLAKFVRGNIPRQGYFDFEAFEKIAAKVVRNLNQIVDRNFYPEDIPEIKYCNLRSRPLGIGVQAQADAFAMMDIVWESKEAEEMNDKIYDSLYYAAVKESVTMAKEMGRPYETFKGSPASNGYFQFDLWDMEEREKKYAEQLAKGVIELGVMKEIPAKASPRYERLREDMKRHGLWNSLLIALMPTASTAQIMRNNECFEPFTMNIYARRVLSGQYLLVNRHMVADFEEMTYVNEAGDVESLWNTSNVRQIIRDKGSVQNIKFPTSKAPISEEFKSRFDFLKLKYKTAFEIPQKTLLDLHLARSRKICQSSSFNCWMKDPNYRKLTAYHFHGWKGGAKTGMYYLRSSFDEGAINYSVDSIVIPKGKKRKVVCTDEVCLSCGS